MNEEKITGGNTVFVILSFEGPDRYSQAGGLGVRVTGLSDALARKGFPTHLVFVGNPKGKSQEVRRRGKLTWHRWCQWISQYYPEGVYQGENEKLYDFNESVPWFVMDELVRPAAGQGKLTVVVGEEWHTAEAMCRMSDLLYYNGLRDKVVLLWNANNTRSFHRINWRRLAYTTVLTTVSKYMKHIMWGMGVNPLVIPNGIPVKTLKRVDGGLAVRLRNLLGRDLILFKMGRWDPDKRWLMAVEAVARLKDMGMKPVFVVRGGIEPHEEEVMGRARSSGLLVKEVRVQGDKPVDYLAALQGIGPADVVNLKSFVSPEFRQLMCFAADAVLANSGHEPFGLFGLEGMAAGGVAYTGCTGEDYAIPWVNAIVLETADPEEIVEYIAYLRAHPDREAAIRRAARQTARQFTWERVIENLVCRLEYAVRARGRG